MSNFSIDDVYPQNLKTENRPSIDMNKIIRENNEKKEKIKKIYKKMLSQCYTEITDANKNDLTDIIYDIPQFIYTEPNYNCRDCIEFIQSKLMKMMIDTYILSERSIFISWHNIELNKKMYKS